MAVESLPVMGSKMIAEARQPGHWLLASMGKRVLRPGGMELTHWMLSHLAIGPADRVVEFAPGMGATARLTLAHAPREYVAVEPDVAAATRLTHRIHTASARVVQASGEDTGLVAGGFSAVYGEAMLSMQTPEKKQRIVAEAARLLQPGGRYGIHELCISDFMSEAERRELNRDMSLGIHVGVQVISGREWRELLETSGFRVQAEKRVPMALLEPRRLLADEGVLGVGRICFNMLRRPAARRRVLQMRQLFRKYANRMQAISLVAVRLG